MRGSGRMLGRLERTFDLQCVSHCTDSAGAVHSGDAEWARKFEAQVQAVTTTDRGMTERLTRIQDLERLVSDYTIGRLAQRPCRSTAMLNKVHAYDGAWLSIATRWEGRRQSMLTNGKRLHSASACSGSGYMLRVPPSPELGFAASTVRQLHGTCLGPTRYLKLSMQRQMSRSRLTDTSATSGAG